MEHILFGRNELSRKRIRKKANLNFIEKSDIGELIHSISEEQTNICLLFILECKEDLILLNKINECFKFRDCLLIPVVNNETRSLSIKAGFNPICKNESKENFSLLLENMKNSYSQWEKEITEEVIENLETYINTIKDKVNSPLAALSLQSQFCLFEDTPIEENKILHNFLNELKDVIKKVTNINLKKLEKKKYSQSLKVYKI